MNNDTIKQIQDAISPIAQKIGEGAAHLYEVYVRQMFAEAITDLVVSGLLLALLVTLLVILYKNRKTIHEKVMDVSDGAAYTFLIFLIFPLIAIPCMLTSGIQKLINPEYFAIERIVDQAKDK